MGAKVITTIDVVELCDYETENGIAHDGLRNVRYAVEANDLHEALNEYIYDFDGDIIKSNDDFEGECLSSEISSASLFSKEDVVETDPELQDLIGEKKQIQCLLYDSCGAIIIISGAEEANFCPQCGTSEISVIEK